MYIKIKNVNLYYTIKGEGETILYLHGGFDTVSNYEKLIDALSDEFKIVAPDRRGHGKSYDNDKSFDLSLMAEEMKELMDTLKIDKFHIIGFSDGANIALHMAYMYPEAVKSVVAISGNYDFHGAEPEFAGLLQLLTPEFVKENMPEVAEQYTQLSPEPDFERYVIKTKKLWTNETSIEKEKLQTLKPKVLVTGGDRDFVTLEHFIDMKRLIPNSSLLILPDAGHFLFQDFEYNIIAAEAVEIFKLFLKQVLPK